MQKAARHREQHDDEGRDRIVALTSSSAARYHNRVPRYRRSMAQYEDFVRTFGARHAEGRPHRDGNRERLRAPDAVPAGRWLPARDDEEGALHGSIAYEPPSRAGHSNVPAGSQEHGVTIWDEGRRWRPRATVYGVAVAKLATARRRLLVDQIAEVVTTLREDPDSRRSIVARGTSADLPPHGARAVPRVLPAPSRTGRVLDVPDPPALRRRLPRRAVQHRELRAPDAHARAASRPRSEATSCGRAATARSTTTIASRSRRCSRASRSRTPSCAWAAAVDLRLRIEDFEVVGYEHHPAIRAPVAVRDGLAGRAFARGGVDRTRRRLMATSRGHRRTS